MIVFVCRRDRHPASINNTFHRMSACTSAWLLLHRMIPYTYCILGVLGRIYFTSFEVFWFLMGVPSPPWHTHRMKFGYFGVHQLVDFTGFGLFSFWILPILFDSGKVCLLVRTFSVIIEELYLRSRNLDFIMNLYCSFKIWNIPGWAL